MRFANNLTYLILSADAVRDRALALVEGVNPKGKSVKWKEEVFHSLFGSSSQVSPMHHKYCGSEAET